MASFNIGDLVVLKSGSMRMCVEGIDGEQVLCVWCHEGVIGRESFDARLLNAWESREDGGFRGGDRKSQGGGRDRDNRGDERPRKPWGGDRDRGDREEPSGGRGRPYGARDRDERPARKTGWDGKPREKKYYRKDD